MKKSFAKWELVILLSISVGVAYYLKFSNESMSTVYNFLWMTSAIIGFFKVFKILWVHDHKENIKPDNLVSSTLTKKSTKATSQMLNPTELGESLAYQTVGIIKKGKGNNMLEKFKNLSHSETFLSAIKLNSRPLPLPFILLFKEVGDSGV